MSTEINGLPGGIVQNGVQTPQTTPATQGRQDGGTAPAAPAGRRDSVSLSADATRLQALESRIADLPVVDSQKVNAVRHEVVTGTFQIDPMGTAEKMLEMERALA